MDIRLVLFDDDGRTALFPFTHTRPVAEIRCGILTMRERWERMLGFSESGTLTEAYLQDMYPTGSADEWLLVHGGVFATKELASAVQQLEPGESLVYEETVIAARLTGKLTADGNRINISSGLP